ncbi:MAG: hypothetical protein MZV70_40610 [Desulfobacterales bacterium]|nr:hypothetical protein [Desulfobacterales bacterium]
MTQGGDVQEGQRERQRHRLRPPDRGHGRQDPDDARLRAPAAGRRHRGLRHLLGPRPGRRDADQGGEIGDEARGTRSDDG